MIKHELRKLEARIASLAQQVMHPPKAIRVKEYFPQENTVTVQFIGQGETFGGDIPKGALGDHHFSLGYRGDISEGLSPQPGDAGFLYFTGFQYKKGYVLLSYTEGGDEASTYVPIRGSWSL